MNKIPMGSPINRSLLWRGQMPVQRDVPGLMDRVVKGEIDPSFVIPHSAKLENSPTCTRWSATSRTAAARSY